MSVTCHDPHRKSSQPKLLRINPSELCLTNKAISMKTLIIKSLLSSLYHREGVYPSLAKRGKGRFSNNVALLLHFLVNAIFRRVVSRVTPWMLKWLNFDPKSGAPVPPLSHA